MSLIMPDGSRTTSLPPRPAAPAQGGGVAVEQLLAYLQQQLKMQFPGMPDADLQEAAKALYGELRTRQADEFNRRFFPERVNQAEPTPRDIATDPAAQKQAAILKRVAEEQANLAKTQAQNEAARRRANPPRPSSPPTQSQYYPVGKAQPIQPPSQGTPYGERMADAPDTIRTGDFVDSDGDGVDDRYQPGPGVRPNTGKPGNMAPIGPKGERWAF